MKGKAARVSCCETHFLPASSLLVLHLAVAGKATLRAGHGGSQSVGQSMPHAAAGPAWEALEGWPWFLGGILLGFAQRWQTSPAEQEAFGKAGAERRAGLGGWREHTELCPFPSCI